MSSLESLLKSVSGHRKCPRGVQRGAIGQYRSESASKLNEPDNLSS